MTLSLAQGASGSAVFAEAQEAVAEVRTRLERVFAAL